MILLFTSFYRDKNPVRQKELELCMKMNIQNGAIDKIFVLCEGDPKSFAYLSHPKITAIESPRPTYQTFFEFANSVSTEDDIVVIANTDIFFDKSLLLCEKMKSNECFALSRYHYHKDGKIKLHNERFSQDTWIFKGKIKPINFCAFYMGIRGCDNRIAYEIRIADYIITNPALSIISVHYHISESRNYGDEAIPKPYLPVDICSLN
jgi:hypothetical protein